MKKILLPIIILLLLVTNIFATESDIKMKFSYKYDTPDILSILRFEGINFDKVSFAGEDLKDKFFIISIKEFTNGKLAKEQIALDSTELGDLGKIKNNTFSFQVLSKRTSENTAKFQFQFERFSTEKEFKVGETFKGFVMKNFLGAKNETPIPVNERAYILTYMMPYMKADGSGAYCEVAQSGANPEEFGIKYKIPTYFLINIKFQ